MEFVGEIIRTSQRKLISNDNQYEIVFRTLNPLILDLGKLPSDSVFKISVNLNGNKPPKPKQENEGYKGI